MKYTKKIQNNPKFDQGVSNNVGWLQKNGAKRRKIIKILPRVPHPSTRGRDPSPSARMRHSGKRLASVPVR
jgi:hypothetical protein